MSCECITRSGAQAAICDNETCGWYIACNTPVPVVHSAQVLAEAYGLRAMPVA